LRDFEDSTASAQRDRGPFSEGKSQEWCNVGPEYRGDDCHVGLRRGFAGLLVLKLNFSGLSPVMQILAVAAGVLILLDR
jgi:hypothetical protein